MILYTEQQLETVYNIDRKERMRLGIPSTTLEQYRVIYEAILYSLYEEYFDE
tara:strand:- start:2845 stop:3000 length:156 start_codon:yes stop_codon:yes gene_type:complete